MTGGMRYSILFKLKFIKIVFCLQVLVRSLSAWKHQKSFEIVEKRKYPNLSTFPHSCFLGYTGKTRDCVLDIRRKGAHPENSLMDSGFLRFIGE